MTPRLARRPVPLIAIEALVAIGLVGGWLVVGNVVGNIVLSLFTQHHSLTIPVHGLPYTTIADGHHSLGAVADASARLAVKAAELRLFDVAPVTFFGMRLLEALTWVTSLMALHLLVRFLRSTRGEHPFSPRNGRRCTAMGWWLLASFGLHATFELLSVQFAKATDIHAAAIGFDPNRFDWTTLLLACCALTAGTLVRYGAELEQEQALTV
ncbi:MAG: DUF2975 domain-containing protein [Planctomycetes bacterium]|nr:DUF2975 domain-containing protein [Planctomycetota bacterium]